MKKLIIITIFLCHYSNSYAQAENYECDKYIIEVVDEFTDDSFAKSKHTQYAGNTASGIFVSLEKHYSGLVMYLKVYGAGHCLDEGSVIDVLFTDETSIELKNGKSWNCKNSSAVYFGKHSNNLEELQDLMNKNIKKMRVQTFEGKVTESFNLESSENIKNTLNCLYDW